MLDVWNPDHCTVREAGVVPVINNMEGTCCGMLQNIHDGSCLLMQPIVLDCVTREANVSAHIQTTAMYSIAPESQPLLKGCTPEMCSSNR